MDTEQLQWFNDAWKNLADAVHNPQSGLRNMVVAHGTGNAVNAYTVVLREALPNQYTIAFYTDQRSPKVQQLSEQNQAIVVLYDNEEKIQLTLKGKVTLHHQNETALQHWQQSGFKSRKSYLAQPAPTMPADGPTDGLAYLHNQEFADGDTAGYENFTVVMIDAEFLECLKLSRKGNRRIQFNATPTDWQGQWLIP